MASDRKLGTVSSDFAVRPAVGSMEIPFGAVPFNVRINGHRCHTIIVVIIYII